jgi:hypothetical protein
MSVTNISTNDKIQGGVKYFWDKHFTLMILMVLITLQNVFTFIKKEEFQCFLDLFKLLKIRWTLRTVSW